MMRDDWVEVNIGTVCEVNPKNTAKNKISANWEVQFLPMKLVEAIVNKMQYTEVRKFGDVQKKSYTYFADNDILFAKVTPCMENGKIVIANKLKNGIGYGSSEFHVLRCSNVILNVYLFHFLIQSKFRSDAQHSMTGAVGLRRVPKKYLENYYIPLAPLPEQRAIVAKIEELFSRLDRGISDLKLAAAQLKIYRQAVLKKAFSGELTQEWRRKQTNLPTASELLQQIKAERHSHHQQQLTDWQKAVQNWEDGGKEGKKPAKPRALKELPALTEEELNVLPTLPIEWKWEKAGSLCNKIQIGPFGTQLHKHEYLDTGIPIINPKHIKTQKIHPQIFISKPKAHSLPQYLLKTNDVIVGRRGEMGRTAPVTEKENNWFCGTGSLFLRFGAMFNGKLYSLIISERRTVNYLNKMGSGTTMTNLNANIVNNLPLPLISLPEQQQIVQEIESRLSVCDQVENTISTSLKQAEALRQSILKKAFSGELLSETVLEQCRNEPDWQPASELLQQIQAEKVHGK